jgi:hypothetical protein
MLFFDYVLAQLAAAKAGRPAPTTQRFAGNYFTHEYVPIEKAAQVPEVFRVYLPSRTIAEAWGMPGDEP